jgi:hypothetical protein
VFARYPSRSLAANTARRASGETFRRPESARDAVDTDTPAAWATS